MVDVLAVLLLLFLVVQAFGSRTLPPALSAVAPAAVIESSPQLVLEVGAAGWTLNGQPVNRADLDAELRALYAGRAVKLLFVRPAPSATAAEVARVLDRARGDGVLLFALLPAER